MSNSDGVLGDMNLEVFIPVCVKQSHHQSQVSHGLVCFVPGAGLYSYLGNKGNKGLWYFCFPGSLCVAMLSLLGSAPVSNFQH